MGYGLVNRARTWKRNEFSDAARAESLPKIAQCSHVRACKLRPCVGNAMTFARALPGQVVSLQYCEVFCIFCRVML